ncbi:glycosyltransferase [Morganella morganii]|uniref:glycosyltransferase n=1 Tax=Morganella morganii TaxID=582 RepID=UPI001C48822B|nr:glycosyltransferase [Morganella morganii]QXO61636.1 glycosyltransferase [Morganella morganii]QXO69108.1 glycosyltransferase [Morganella morganii]
MEFDNDSDVTIVITSCDRFDLLKETITSLDINNTYKIKEVIITEDSGNENIKQCIPAHWNCRVLINNPKLGQLKSIDLAYSFVTTPYIFHCEDDWMFYRKGFIEDSLEVLNSNKNILQVWLRDFTGDISKCYSFHSISNPKIINDITYFKLESCNPNWKGFSLNPGLRRKSDYEKEAPFYRNKPAIDTESEISIAYFNMGMFSVILEKSAVYHLGWGRHVSPGKVE